MSFPGQLNRCARETALFPGLEGQAGMWGYFPRAVLHGWGQNPLPTATLAVSLTLLVLHGLLGGTAENILELTAWQTGKLLDNEFDFFRTLLTKNSLTCVYYSCLCQRQYEIREKWISSRSTFVPYLCGLPDPWFGEGSKLYLFTQISELKNSR